MQRKGYVSLWFGDVDCSGALEDFLKTTYTEDGDLIPSRFMDTYQISRYDEGFREAEYFERHLSSVRDLLSGFSYDEQIIPRFISIVGENAPFPVNAVLLLYNFYVDRDITQHQPSPKANGVDMQFIGCVEYES